MAARSPSIRNWRTSPPGGGWALDYTVPETGTVVRAEGQTHEEVLGVIRAHRTNNGLPANDGEVFAWADEVWCRRDPARCLRREQPAPHPGVRRTLTPVDYGPACWGFLHAFGVSFDAVRWQHAVQQVVSLLNPRNPHNNGSGCSVCHAHFQEFVTAHPPERVQSAEQAAVWTWLAHDTANAHASKARRPSYDAAAWQHGWVRLGEGEFDTIRRTLRA